MLVLIVAAALLVSAVVAGFLLIGRGSHARAGVSAQARAQVVRNSNVTILYGTQTNTAQRFSQELKEALQQSWDNDKVYDIIDVEDYEFEDKLPKESLVFMMLATYGDGEPTTSAAAFFEWLTTLGDKPSGNSTLEGVKFGVFGLGNKQYVDFCAVGKRVHKAMQDCGAQPVVHNGEGNDDDNIQADFELWKGQLLEALKNRNPLNGSDSHAIPGKIAA